MGVGSSGISNVGASGKSKEVFMQDDIAQVVYSAEVDASGKAKITGITPYQEIYEQEKKKMFTPLADSGARMTYESGAQRETVHGKGRCDLLPFDVLAEFTNEEFFEILEKVMYGNVDLKEKQKLLLDLLDVVRIRVFADDSTAMILGAAQQYEDGALKYAENNWRKGLPFWSFIDSGTRHFLKWLREDDDEPHDRAIAWNIMGAIWTLNREIEKNDISRTV